MVNFDHTILGIAKDATSEQIREAFKEKAAKLAPRVVEGDMKAMDELSALADVFKSLYGPRLAIETYERDYQTLVDVTLPEEKRVEAGLRVIDYQTLKDILVSHEQCIQPALVRVGTTFLGETLRKLFCDENIPQAVRKQIGEDVYARETNEERKEPDYSEEPCQVFRIPPDLFAEPDYEKMVAETDYNDTRGKLLHKMASANFLREEIREWTGKIYLDKLASDGRFLVRCASDGDPVAHKAFLKFSEFYREISRIKDDDRFAPVVRLLADKELNDLRRLWKTSKERIAEAEGRPAPEAEKPRRRWQFWRRRQAETPNPTESAKPKVCGKI